MRQGDRPRMSRGENDSHDASLGDEDDLYVGIVFQYKTRQFNGRIKDRHAF